MSKWTQSIRDSVVIKGVPISAHLHFARDRENRKPPSTVFYYKGKNSEEMERDWLVYSQTKESFFCFPCLLFSQVSMASKPSFARSEEGYSHLKHTTGWRRLNEKLMSHQNSPAHQHLFVEWKTLLSNIKRASTVDLQVIAVYNSEVEKWRNLFKRYLDTLLFLATHNLALRGSSSKVFESSNGNFLGLLELLAKYDPLLNNHLNDVKEAQRKGKQLVNYLSGKIQNELLSLCADKVRGTILKRRKDSKYFGLICDATPDKSRTEQTTIVLRYVHFMDGKWQIEESFIEYTDYNLKKGTELAQHYLSRLKHFEIPFMDMRSQGYDNGANMAGVHKGVQAEILKVNPFAIFSSCGAHSLNLCGVHAVRSTEKGQKYFKNIQRLYVLFSGSPGRWYIVTSILSITFKPQSETRWSERIDAVKPVATQQPRVIECLDELIRLYSDSLTPDALNTAKDLLKYFKSFDSIIQGTIWIKVLQTINETSLLLQSTELSLDQQVILLGELKQHLSLIRDSFPKLLKEAQLVALAMNIDPHFKIFGIGPRGLPRRVARPNVGADSTEIQMVSTGILYIFFRLFVSFLVCYPFG